MADKTRIEWTDATWNPITGCSVVSPGCTNCYAMKLAGTRLQHHPSREGLTNPSKAGPVWNGKVRLNEQWLQQPLQWSKPRRVFVCAHGDLFHESVPDEWIDKVFAVMALSPQHQFQVLTKRAERMRDYFAAGPYPRWVDSMIEFGLSCERKGTLIDYEVGNLFNVWLGVSVEDQARAMERVPALLETPAAVRFVSAEPLLGEVDLEALEWRHFRYDALRGIQSFYSRESGWEDQAKAPAIDWVIVGGESGRGARPMHPEWARSLRVQCQAAGVPFFFKQWGSWLPHGQWHDAFDESLWRTDWMLMAWDGGLDVPDGCWPDPEQGEAAVLDVGKSKAGRVLDAREWNEMPAELHLNTKCKEVRS